jgi:rod shape-determining protein MreD
VNRRADGRGIRYVSVGNERRVLIEQIKLGVTLALTGLILMGLETTALSRIRIPLFGWQAASPALGLLFSMAVGFLHGEREGGVTGLIAGWLADSTLGEGMMLYPLLYFLCGYLSGTVGKRSLAHNLPSFGVFAAVGGGLKCLLSVLTAIIELKTLPPAVWVWKGLIPPWVLTVLFSAAVYGIVKGEQWLQRPKNEFGKSFD